jgi:adenylosuccinate synthase
VVVAPDALIREIALLEGAGIAVRERLLISHSCALVLPLHVALDSARESARGDKAIGTTGRGIGPAYEDKVARRGLRAGDFLQPEALEERLRELWDYHNFVLTRYYGQAAIDYPTMRDEVLGWGETIRPMLTDVAECLYRLQSEHRNILFEGAQGAMLDIDHGTYPYVTSSNTTAGGAVSGTGIGLLDFDYVLGITKAYSTRVGNGPFPTELFDEVGEHLSARGAEFGATTGRRRRCGWFDAVLMRKSAHLNSLSGLCLTKLDVLDGLPQIGICVGYRLDGEELHTIPSSAEVYQRCAPIIETMPGWSESTAGIRRLEDLPKNARSYIERLEGLVGVSVDILSTGPDRLDTISLRNPFAD